MQAAAENRTVPQILEVRDKKESHTLIRVLDILSEQSVPVSACRCIHLDGHAAMLIFTELTHPKHNHIEQTLAEALGEGVRFRFSDCLEELGSGTRRRTVDIQGEESEGLAKWILEQFRAHRIDIDQIFIETSEGHMNTREFTAHITINPSPRVTEKELFDTLFDIASRRSLSINF